jgi:hypothetical protein
MAVGTLFILVLCASTSAGRTVYTLNELTAKIKNNHISDLWLADGGLGGIETNQYNLPADDFLVVGDYPKIPETLVQFATQHGVKIRQSQRYNDLHSTAPSYIQFVLTIIYYAVTIGILIMLVLIYRKLNTALRILNKKDEENETNS